MLQKNKARNIVFLNQKSCWGPKVKKKLTQKDIKFKKLLKVFCLFSAVHTSTLWLGVEGVICSIWVLSEGKVRLSITKTVTTMYGNEFFF